MPVIAPGWISASLPENEVSRLAALHGHQLDFFTNEVSFDHITQLAAKLFQCPISLVTLVDETHQRFKSHHGLLACATPRDMSFCAHAISAGKSLIVLDAAQDERFKGNPLVVGDPNIRFYAGALLTDKQGFHLGTLCIIDNKPRQTFTADEMASLENLSQIAMDSISVRSSYSAEIAQKKILDNIFDQIPLGIFVKNAKDDFRFYFVNSYANELFECSDNQIINLTDFDLFRKEEAAFFRATDINVMKEHSVVKISEEKVTTKRGTWTARTHKIPLYDENGDPFLLMGLIEDITDQIRQKEQLEEATRIAQDANRAKSEFLANMSHEIRTPLNGVLATAELFTETNLDEKQKKYLSLIQSSGAILLGLINDILDYSKIEANMLELSEQAFDLHRVMELTFQLFEIPAQNKGLTFTATIHPDVPSWIIADPQRLRQIVVNLLSNALKYTTTGTVSVAIDVVEEQGQPRLFISVQDTGRGIPENAQNMIFEKFTRINKAEFITGTGLGLAICHSLVNLMGGTIGVASKLDAGSTFWFHIPLKVPRDSTLLSAPTPPLDQPKTRAFRALIVEDNETNKFVLQAMLENMGCSVRCADNGRTALDEIHENEFDIIFMDCNMPVMNGYDATRAIRNDYNLKTPIIGVSAHVFLHEVQNCIAAGMNDFLPKPIRKHDLTNMINRWLPSVAPLQSLVTANHVTGNDTIVFEEKRLDDLRQEMGKKFQPMIKIALSNAADLYEKVIMACQHGDMDGITMHSHALKSIASQLGMTALFEACVQLERCGRNKEIKQIDEIQPRLAQAYNTFHQKLLDIVT